MPLSPSGTWALSLVSVLALGLLWRVAAGTATPLGLRPSVLTLLVVGAAITGILGFVVEENSASERFHATFLWFVAGVALTLTRAARPIATLGVDVAPRAR